MRLEGCIVLIVLTVRTRMLRLFRGVVQRIVQRRDQSATDQEANGEQRAHESHR